MMDSRNMMTNDHDEVVIHTPVVELAPFLDSSKQSMASLDPKKTLAPKSAARKKWILATVVLLILSIFGVLEGQLAAVGFSRSDFQAPFFHTALRFLFRSLAFPLSCLGRYLYALLRKRPFSFKNYIKHCSLASGAEGFGVRTFVRYYFLPTITVVGAGLFYIEALIYVQPSVATAFLVSTVALSYVLCMLFFGHRHLVIKTFFVVLSMSGVGLVAYATTTDPMKEDAYIGVICMIGSLICLTLHLLFYTKSFADADSDQAAFSVTIMFGVGLLVYWPVPLILWLTEVEKWSVQTAPWPFLIGSVSSSLVVAFLYAFCLTLSSPFFVSLGDLLSLTLGAVSEYFIRGKKLPPLQIVGSCIIGLSFVFLLLPDDKLSVDFRRLLRRRKTSAVPPADQTIKNAHLHDRNPPGVTGQDNLKQI